MPACPATGRMVAAALLFAALYLALFPCMFMLCVTLTVWETLRWLMASVLLVPAMTAIGLWGLLPALPLIALLIGATAARWPDRAWLRLLLALLLPLVELILIREAGLPWLAGRLLPLLMDHRALLLIGTVAPLLSSGLAAMLVPAGLMRRVLRSAAP